MRPLTLVVIALAAVAAAKAFPIALSAGDADTEPRVAPATAAPERSTERPRADRAPAGRRSAGDGRSRSARRQRGAWSAACSSPRAAPASSPGTRTCAAAPTEPGVAGEPTAWCGCCSPSRASTAAPIQALARFSSATSAARTAATSAGSSATSGTRATRTGSTPTSTSRAGTGRAGQPEHAGDIDRRLSQDLVDRFVRAGATKVFVGPGTGLTGPPDVVQVIPDHDDHMHVRIEP